MVAWTAACLANLPLDRWERVEHAPRGLAPARPSLVRGREPDWRRLREALTKMEAFTRWMTKPDGRVAQFGDNDSGRFFRLPGYLWTGEGEPADDSLDHAETVHVLAALRGDAPLSIAGRIVAALALWSGTAALPTPPASVQGLVGRCESDRWDLGAGCWDGLETAAFPSFGAFVWRSKRVWMAVRCGSVGQGGLGGHAHCDALTLELQVDGQDWIADPGTAEYTSDPATRNRYRSVLAHYCPRVPGREPSSLDRGVFRLSEYGARCFAFGPEGFVGVHAGYGGEVRRMVRLTDMGFELNDSWDKGELAPLPVASREEPWAAVPFSPGYGSVRD